MERESPLQTIQSGTFRTGKVSLSSIQNIKTITLVRDPSFTTFHVYRWPDLAILNVKGVRNLAGGKRSQN